MSSVKDLPRQFADYTLEKVLGRGSISTAFQAMHRQSRDKVVLKQIHPFLAEEPEQVDLFVSEAQVLSELKHPAIGRILDVGLEDGVPYLALEFVEGRDLTAVMTAQERNGSFPIPLAVHIVRQVAMALHHVHTRKSDDGKPLEIVHRDMSMNNVMVRYDGTIVVVDFGIAKSTLRETRTAVGHVRGTPGYMAPEQLLGNNVDSRTDIFVLGVVLYRLVTKKAPFPVVVGDFASYRAPLTTIPAPPHLVNPDIPESLSVAILQAMQKDHVRRYQTAEQFARDLREVERQEKFSATELDVANLMGRLFPRVEEEKELDTMPDGEPSEATVLERKGGGGALDAAIAAASRIPTFDDEAPTEMGSVDSVLEAMEDQTKTEMAAPEGIDQSALDQALFDARLGLSPVEGEFAPTISETSGSKPAEKHREREKWKTYAIVGAAIVLAFLVGLFAR